MKYFSINGSKSPIYTNLPYENERQSLVKGQGSTNEFKIQWRKRHGNIGIYQASIFKTGATFNGNTGLQC
jgi:hypothetical protein